MNGSVVCGQMNVNQYYICKVRQSTVAGQWAGRIDLWRPEADTSGDIRKTSMGDTEVPYWCDCQVCYEVCTGYKETRKGQIFICETPEKLCIISVVL